MFVAETDEETGEQFLFLIVGKKVDYETRYTFPTAQEAAEFIVFFEENPTASIYAYGRSYGKKHPAKKPPVRVKITEAPLNEAEFPWITYKFPTYEDDPNAA